MDSKLFASTEFYNKRYQNFSTLIIIPIFVFLVGILALTIWGKVDVNVSSSGSINPSHQIYPIMGSQDKIIHKYVSDGQVVKKGQKLFSYFDNHQSLIIKATHQGVFYLTDQKGKLGYLYPKITAHSLIVDAYIPAKNVGEVSKNQTVSFSTNLNEQSNLISGKVSNIAYLPYTYHGESYYLAKCSIEPSLKQLRKLRYGINGKLTIKTNKVSRECQYLCVNGNILP